MIERLYVMCQGRPWEAHMTMTFSLESAPEAIEYKGGEAEFLLRQAIWSLLGVDIPIERMKAVPRDTEAFVRIVNEAAVAGRRDLQVTDTFRHELLSWGKAMPRRRRRRRRARRRGQETPMSRVPTIAIR